MMFRATILGYFAISAGFAAGQFSTTAPSVATTTSSESSAAASSSSPTSSAFQSSSSDNSNSATLTLTGDTSLPSSDSLSSSSSISGNVSSSATISSNSSSMALSSSFPMATGLPSGTAGLLRVSANDPRISTIGSNWVVGTSTCDAGQPSMSNTMTGQSLSFSFTGTGIYMVTTSSNNTGSWTVAVDSQAPETVNGFGDQISCGSTWSATGLNNTNHTVTVTLAGGSGSATGFELDEFLIQQTVAGISMQTAHFVTATATAIVGNATAAAGQQAAQHMVNATVSATDPRIVVSGSGWDTKPSTCDSQIPSRQNSNPGQILTFQFTGAAVYLAAARTNISGGYTVALDGQSATAIDGFTPGKNPTCGFSWSATSLENSAHSVTINVTGQSAQAASDGTSATTFEFQGFTIMQSGAISHADVRVWMSFAVLLLGCALSY